MPLYSGNEAISSFSFFEALNLSPLSLFLFLSATNLFSFVLKR